MNPICIVSIPAIIGSSNSSNNTNVFPNQYFMIINEKFRLFRSKLNNVICICKNILKKTTLTYE